MNQHTQLTRAQAVKRDNLLTGLVTHAAILLKDTNKQFDTLPLGYLCALRHSTEEAVKEEECISRTFTDLDTAKKVYQSSFVLEYNAAVDLSTRVSLRGVGSK